MITALFAPLGSTSVPVPALDSIAAKTVRAERNLVIEDADATALRREQALAAIRLQFNYNPDMLFERRDAVVAALDALFERFHHVINHPDFDDSLDLLPPSKAQFDRRHDTEQPVAAGDETKQFGSSSAMMTASWLGRESLSYAPYSTCTQNIVLRGSSIRPTPSGA